MIKNAVIKACASNVPKSPRAGTLLTRRTYVTEASDYVYNISRGNIAGVDPLCVSEDPVCSQILKEMNGEDYVLALAGEIETAHADDESVLGIAKTVGGTARKASVSSPRKNLHSSRLFHSEAVDYALGLRGGQIAGTAASAADECPICTKILKEIYIDDPEAIVTGDAALNTADECTEELAAKRALLALWVMQRRDDDTSIYEKVYV